MTVVSEYLIVRLSSFRTFKKLGIFYLCGNPVKHLLYFLFTEGDFFPVAVSPLFELEKGGKGGEKEGEKKGERRERGKGGEERMKKRFTSSFSSSTHPSAMSLWTNV